VWRNSCCLQLCHICCKGILALSNVASVLYMYVKFFWYLVYVSLFVCSFCCICLYVLYFCGLIYFLLSFWLTYGFVDCIFLCMYVKVNGNNILCLAPFNLSDHLNILRNVQYRKQFQLRALSMKHIVVCTRTYLYNVIRFSVLLR
jgi:hypothetical protein